MDKRIRRSTRLLSNSILNSLITKKNDDFYYSWGPIDVIKIKWRNNSDPLHHLALERLAIIYQAP